MANGILLAIEGIDAAGKRTQSFLLEGRLRAKSLKAATISFPDYKTAIGMEIRAFLNGERSYPAEVRHMLFAANRWEKKAELEEVLSKLDLVIVNRYSASNYAYGTANGLPLDWLMGLESGLPKPDLVLLLDAPVASLSGRRRAKRDNWESDQQLQSEAARAYRELAGKLGWKIINAADSMESTNDAITKEVLALLSSRGKP